MTPAVVQGSAPPPPWVPGSLEGTWTLLASYPALLALAIVAVALVASGGVRAGIRFWGLRLTARTHTEVDDDLVKLVAAATALVLLYLGILAAVEVLPLGERAGTVLTRLLLSVLTVQLMRAALKAAHLTLLGLSSLRERFPFVEERTIPLFDLSFTLLIVGIAAYALIQVWNLDPTAWLASAGIVGIAVGFAARDTLANLFAGFSIIADTPYKLGDYVVLDSGERGEVTRVGIRSTRLLTRDDVEVTIPNSVMANTKIVNESGGRWTRFRIRLKVGVAYGSDVDQVVALLERAALANSTVCRDPSPRVRMRGFGDSSLDFELLCWVEHPAERGLVTHQLFMSIYKALEDEGMEIPFPQRDLWIRQGPSTGAAQDD